LALLIGAASVAAQESPRAPKSREILKSAIDAYKRQDFESAAALFAQAQLRRDELDTNDRLDLETFGTQNTSALQARQEGATQLFLAGEAINQGRTGEAAKLLKAANVNQYLSPTDRQVLVSLNTRLQAGADAPATPGGKADPKALLAAARAALKQGDLSGAERFTNEAEKSGAAASWLQPWADTPAAVRRDIQAARAKQPAPTVEQPEHGPGVPPIKNYAGRVSIGSDAGVPGTLPSLPEKTSTPTSPYAIQQPPAPPPLGQADPTPDKIKMVGTGPAEPSQPAKRPTGLPPPKQAIARQMMVDGYRALEAGDLETARLNATRARDLHVELDAKELNPEQLLLEVQKKAAAIAVARTAANATPKDARNLIQEGRALLKLHKFDEAEIKCSQAAAVTNTTYRLFEDSPERLRNDIQRARDKRNREQADRLLVEARRLFAKGDYKDAKAKAWEAQTLHGPYGPFDFGDRPQKLLAEIARVEPKAGTSDPGNAMEVARNAAQSPASPPTARDTPRDTQRGRAAALVAEARELERRGLLFDAAQKAAQAKKLGVMFAPGDDSPDAVMMSLAARSRSQIQGTLQQVTESLATRPGDPALLQKAQGDLAGARQLALAFGLDTVPVDQKAAWVQQVALTAGISAAGNVSTVAHADFREPAGPAAQGKRKEGMDKLDLARLELRKGNYPMARKLAEGCFDAVYGVQQEAVVVLRDIDAEEHNQRLLAAQRTFEAGVDAYVHGDYKRAATILVGVDVVLLPPQLQQRMRDIMSTREMLPQPARSDEHKILLTGGTKTPGTAVAGDQTDDALDHVKVMERVQFEQMSYRSIEAKKSAGELFKAGQKLKAIELLSGQLNQIELAQLSADMTRQLKAPLEKRISEYRTVMAQELLDDQRKGLDKKLGWDEGKYQANIRKQQDQVADLIKQCSALNKEGKYKEGLAMAYKARELDPDNTAATAYIMMTNILIEQKKNEENKAETDDYFLQSLRISPGKTPTDRDPFQVSEDGLKRLKGRKESGPIWQQPKNQKERQIEYRLTQPIQFGCKDMPLREVITMLGSLSGIPIFPDETALREANVNLDHPLTMDCPLIGMKSALNILLDKISLTYVIENESLLITTKDKAHKKYKLVVHPVADLVIPVENHQDPDVFNLQKVLEKHLNSQYPNSYTGVSPVTAGPMSMQPGLPVSSYNSGLGSAFAANAPNQPPSASGYNPVQNRASGQSLENLLQELIKGTIHPHTWKEMGGQGTMQYYPLGMALVINQQQEVQEDVEELLKALRRLLDMEIAIEMRLVLVSESFYERIGVDFDVNLRTPTNAGAENQLLNSSFTPFGTVNRNLSFNRFITGLTPAGTLTPDLNVPIKPSSYNFSVPPFGGYTAPGVDGGLSLGLAFLSEIQVFMVLEAAQADSRTNIMQAPKITVFNGQAATIAVSTTQFLNIGINATVVAGQLVFIPTNTPVTVGLTLVVTPVVSADRRFVRLSLAPNITNIVSNSLTLFPSPIVVPNVVEGPIGLGVQTGQPQIFNSFSITRPTISRIALATTVNVPDGGTVLLGGLKTLSEGRNEAGPPILSKIPYLDRLFRNVGWGREAQSLMLMVTPRIIINEEEEAIYTGREAPIPRP
jgi:Flp pilus assembly secretin CpaC